MANEEKKLYGVQFHPEVNHTPEGQKMLVNFLVDVCGCSQDWIMSDFAEEQVAKLREKSAIKSLIALSGGVDSSVAAVLIHRAVGNN